MRDELRNEPYRALKEIVANCLNKIDNVADCSKIMQGVHVNRVRVNARKVQASVLQLIYMIREEDIEERIMENGSTELQKEMVKLRAENIIMNYKRK